MMEWEGDEWRGPQGQRAQMEISARLRWDVIIKHGIFCSVVMIMALSMSWFTIWCYFQPTSDMPHNIAQTICCVLLLLITPVMFLQSTAHARRKP